MRWSKQSGIKKSRRRKRAWTPRRRGSICDWGRCRLNCRWCHGGGRARTRSSRSGKKLRNLLQVNAGLEAKTVFEYLQRRIRAICRWAVAYVAATGEGWRATEGPAKEVFFAQQHLPGRLGASDFTHMDELGITIQGQSFPHLIYHFVLTYSNWEAGTVCFSESFESLCEGFAERGVGAGQGAAPASDRPAVDGGEQHERSGRVHRPLRRPDALLRNGRRKDPGRAWATRTATSSSGIIGSSGPWSRN